jgi:hypothetical protein
MRRRKMLWRWVRGSKGLQTLEWVAIGLVVVALLAALAFGLRRTEAGPGEALSAASLGRGIVL